MPHGLQVSHFLAFVVAWCVCVCAGDELKGCAVRQHADIRPLASVFRTLSSLGEEAALVLKTEETSGVVS